MFLHFRRIPHQKLALVRPSFGSRCSLPGSWLNLTIHLTDHSRRLSISDLAASEREKETTSPPACGQQEEEEERVTCRQVSHDDGDDVNEKLSADQRIISNSSLGLSNIASEKR